MVVRPKEIIDETILYQVKRIMNDVYSENLPLDEAQLKTGVVTFFERKKQFLADLKTKYGTDYAGSKAAAVLYQDFSAILKSMTLSLFSMRLSTVQTALKTTRRRWSSWRDSIKKEATSRRIIRML